MPNSANYYLYVSFVCSIASDTGCDTPLEPAALRVATDRLVLIHAGRHCLEQLHDGP